MAIDLCVHQGAYVRESNPFATMRCGLRAATMMLAIFSFSFVNRSALAAQLDDG